MKLYNHVRKMNDRVVSYLEPVTTLVDEPKASDEEVTAFIADMIYLLDGPEYREVMEHYCQEMKLNNLTASVRKWANDRNLIEGATSQAQTVKLFEEGGEVAHAVARGNMDELKDGIGDMAVVLIILAAQNGMDFEECLASAYDEIKDRKGRMVDGIFVKEE